MELNFNERLCHAWWQRNGEPFRVFMDLFRSIPSLEIEDASVLDEFYWLNKEDPNYSRCRVIEERVNACLQTETLL